MENLIVGVSEAIERCNYASLSRIFSDDVTLADSNPSFLASCWQSIGPGEKRSLAAHLIQSAVTGAPASFLEGAVSNEEMQQVLIKALGHLPTTVEHAADNTLRQYLFDYLVNHSEDYTTAAQILGGMRMEDSVDSIYYVAPADKMDVYVKIAECCLACDQTAEADAAVNKAGSVVASVEKKPEFIALLLRYKSTCARVLDCNRKFLQAAQRYHELSCPSVQSLSSSYSAAAAANNDLMIDADDLLQMLGRAATCAILAPSGTQRQRVLGHIFQDDRLSELDHLDQFSTHSLILKKMFRQEILPPNSTELVQFEASLADHQKAIMGDGLTILERGLVEHNMIAVSKLYRTIYVKELAHHLGVTSEQKAEKICASMIMEGTLHGSIDQVEGLLEFEPEEPQTLSWDRSITNFCVELNRVTDAVKAANAG